MKNIFQLPPKLSKCNQSGLDPHWTTCPVWVMTLAGTLFYCKLLLNGASHDTKIGCVRLVSTIANKYKCSFLSFAGPLRTCVSWERVFGSRLEFFFWGGGKISAPHSISFSLFPPRTHRAGKCICCKSDLFGPLLYAMTDDIL